MVDTQFLSRATHSLQSILGQLEAQDSEGLLELDDDPDALTIAFENGRQLVLNIHRASGEVWLASPISGGLHFRWNSDAPHWRLSDGRDLYATLAEDIRKLSGAVYWQLQESAA